MFHIIEKIEDEWAIIEWGKETFRIPKYLLPASAKHGDSIKIEVLLQRDDDRLRGGRGKFFEAE